MVADVIELARWLSNQKPSDLIKDAVNSGDVEAEIVDVNTRQQLGFFEDSEGKKLSSIGGEYSPFTQEVKGLGPKEINLNDTGKFWDSFKVSPIKDGYRINANTFKDGQDLTVRWGDDIIGIQKEKRYGNERFIEKKIWNKAQKSL